MDNERVLKDRFAAGLLRNPTNPFKVACEVVGDDTSAALRVANSWPHDMYVITRQAVLLEQYGEDFFMPTKTDVARRLWDLAETTRDARDKRESYRLYAEIRGYIDNGGVNINNNVQVNQNRVMVIKDYGSDEQWETAAKNQQYKLVAGARD